MQDAMAPWAQREMLPLTGAGIDVGLMGAAIGGVVAGLLVGRIRIAVPLTLALGSGLWYLARVYETTPPPQNEQRGVLVTLLVTTGLAAVFGALGSRRSVVGAVAI